MRMKNAIGGLQLLALALFTSLLHAAPEQPSKEALQKIADSLQWQTGTITLKGGLAKIDLNETFRFLDHANAEKVLHDLWGNPEDPDTLGMIFPSDVGPLDKQSWGVVVQYEEGGYVKDDDAEKINYTDLLKKMQDEIKEANPEREKAGYGTLELVGWAAAPRYDKAAHKLYWAKEVKFDGEPDNTLNYNIRVLGRRGVLVLNAVAAMSEFPAIEQKMPQIISMVDFKTGNQYADFDSKTDKIAEYGLTALVAGGALGAAAKLGMLGAAWKFILAGAIALKKVILVAVVALVAGVKKFWGRFTGKSSTPPNV